MKPLHVAMSVLVLLQACASPTGVSDTARPSAGSALVAPRTFQALDDTVTCDGIARASVRFSDPGFASGSSVGLFYRYEGLPAGAKTLEVWWNEEAPDALPERFELGEGDPSDGTTFTLRGVVEHLYENVTSETRRRVRATLRVEGHDGDCPRVRTVVLRPVTTTSGPSAPTTIDLTLTGSASSPFIAPAGNFSYDLRIDNAGPATATGVTLTVNLPSGAFSYRPTASCTFAGTVATCTIADIPSGGTVVKSVFAMAPAASGRYTGSASVTASETETNAADNAITIPTTVR